MEFLAIEIYRLPLIGSIQCVSLWNRSKNNLQCAFRLLQHKCDMHFTDLLKKRGWVLQERVLSPATLYYWTSEMFWECLGCTASESQSKPIMNSDSPMKTILRGIQREGLTRHPDDHLTAWYLFVEEYTSRE